VAASRPAVTTSEVRNDPIHRAEESRCGQLEERRSQVLLVCWVESHVVSSLRQFRPSLKLNGRYGVLPEGIKHAPEQGTIDLDLPARLSRATRRKSSKVGIEIPDQTDHELEKAESIG